MEYNIHDPNNDKANQNQALQSDFHISIPSVCVNFCKFVSWHVRDNHHQWPTAYRRASISQTQDHVF